MSAPLPPIDFIDLKAQRRRLGTRIDRAIMEVVDHGQYVMGPEVFDLERLLADFTGAKFCLSCGSGTEALALVLMAWGLKPGDAVFCPAFTFVATAEVVAWLGAIPVFVDVLPDSFNMDPDSLERAIAGAKAQGLKPRAVMPVDLFGQPADYRRILPIAAAHGLKVLSDAAQGFGGTLDGVRVGNFGAVTATSFFPAKPLGCYGEGGALFTEDEELAEIMRSLRVHGMGRDRYDNVRIGMNGRLETIQAAVLIQKLSIFEDEIAARQRVAERYNAALADVVTVPTVIEGATSVWAQYTVQLKPGTRDAVMAALRAEGVPSAVYYPIPLSRQQAYKHYPSVPGGVPVSEDLATRVISLPMHPYLDEATQDRVIAAFRKAVS